jgi:S1-C subfamily serine protease
LFVVIAYLRFSIVAEIDARTLPARRQDRTPMLAFEFDASRRPWSNGTVGAAPRLRCHLGSRPFQDDQMMLRRLSRSCSRCAAVVAGALSMLLALSQTALATDGANAAASAAPAQLENAVVKMFSTIRGPDSFKPWGKAAPREVSGSGVVVEGNRILTNWHVVAYASQVQVQANQGGDRISATVVAGAPGIDLAVLKLDDESFFATRKPPVRADVLPEIKDAVFAYGYPTGGSSLSTTKGIVSRIEFVGYSYYTSGLRIQVDAAINPGNSGGPVFAGDKMIGLAFSAATNAQNISYIIPNAEIELFLRDIADGHYDGKPAMFDSLQTLENPALRSYLKLDASIHGMVVQKPAQASSSYPLREWDVITHIGDAPIDNQGMVRVGALGVRFQYLVQQLAKNGTVPLTIVRGGRSMTVQVPVSVSHPQLIPSLMGNYPSYFICGPIVFTVATNEFRKLISDNAALLNFYAYNASPLVTQLGDEPSASREELVVIGAPFFPHKLVNGYSSRQSSVVYSINDKPVRSLIHLVTLLRDLKDDLVVIKFDQRFGESVVLPRKELLESTGDILNDNGIRSQGSKDVMDVWQSAGR